MRVDSPERRDLTSELADVTQLGLTELRGLEDSALARAMRRIHDEVDRAQGSVAGWQSAI